MRNLELILTALISHIPMQLQFSFNLPVQKLQLIF